MILFYSGAESDSTQPICRMMSDVLPDQEFDICRSFVSLYQLFHQPGFDPNLAVLIPGSKEGLKNIISLRDLLLDKRIILILPDRDAESISMAHIISPRFLGYADSPYKLVGAVIKKMAEKFEIARLQNSETQQVVSSNEVTVNT
jgi:hypothetical protein